MIRHALAAPYYEIEERVRVREPAQHTPPQFGARCDCGHLAFLHVGGLGACIAGTEYAKQERCGCARASATDEKSQRWAN